MDKRRRRERIEARKEQALSPEERLWKRWREKGDLDAAAELTNLLSDKPAPKCQDCGAPLDPDRFDEENPERLGELGLLDYGPGPVCTRCWSARDWLREEESDFESGAYVYAADVWCTACGMDIRRRLEREGRGPKPFELQGGEPYDSGDYPAGPVDHAGEQTDSPQHCAAGQACLRPLEQLDDGRRHPAWIEGRLTDEGERYVREQLLSDPTSLVLFWASVYEIDLPGELAPDPFTCDRCERGEQRWYGEWSCGECEERFCSSCEDEGGVHPGHHSCQPLACDECSSALEECRKCGDDWCPGCDPRCSCEADVASGNPSDRRRRLERRAARGDAAAAARLAEGRGGPERPGRRDEFFWRRAPGYRSLVWVKPGTYEEFTVGRAFVPGGGGVMFQVLDDEGPFPHVDGFAEAKQAIIDEVTRRLRLRRSERRSQNPGDRRLERRAARGDRDAEAKLLLRRVEIGVLPPEALEVAAVLGHPVAARAVGQTDIKPLRTPEDLRTGPERLRAIFALIGRRDALRWGLDVVGRVLPIYEEMHPGDPRPRRVVDLGRRLLAGEGPLDAAESREVENASHAALDAYNGTAFDGDGSDAAVAARAAADAAVSLGVGLTLVRDARENATNWLTAQLYGAANAAGAAVWRAATHERDAYKADEVAWMLRRLADYALGEVADAEPFAEGDGGAKWRGLVESERTKERELRARLDALIEEAVKQEQDRQSRGG